jgi:sensor domain CHASE-containing protein
MNEALQQKGGDIFSTGQGRQFQTMNQEGLVTLQVEEQQELKISIKRRELEVQIKTKIHLMERLVVIIDMEPFMKPCLDPL